MVVIFSFITLAVGIYFSRRVTTLREYAVGNKDFSTTTLVFTALATMWGGGGLVRTVEEVYDSGLWWMIVSLTALFGPWIIGQLALRMGGFMGHLSVAETIGSLYGRYARMIVVLSGIATNIIVIAGQVSILVKTADGLAIAIDPKFIAIIATLILIFYSAFGGVRAVTTTDVLQFITFTLIIPCLGWFVYLKIEQPISQAFTEIQGRPRFQLSHFLSGKSLLGLVAFLLGNLMDYTRPSNIQRIYMSKDSRQARRVFNYATCFSFLITICIVLIGLFVCLAEPRLAKGQVWNYILTDMPNVLRGLLAIALLAMAMSTADSCLNNAAVLVSHDLVGAIRKKKDEAQTWQLRLAKLTVAIVGLSAMVIHFYCRDLLELLKISLSVSVPMVTAPFILAIFGFRGSGKCALVGMATGIVSIIIWNAWIKPATGIDGSFICMMINGMVMVGCHYCSSKS